MLPAVTRQDQSTPHLIQVFDDPCLFILPRLHNRWDCVKALMAKEGAGADALKPEQLQHPDRLGSHAT